MMATTRTAVALWAVISLAWPRVAGADEATAARLHFSEGTRLADAGRLHEALGAFLQAAALAPTATTHANIATLLGELGLPEEEFLSWQEALAQSPPDDVRERAEQRLGHLRVELSVVHLRSEPPGADVFVDRADLGRWARTPCTIALRPGRDARLTVRLDGYEDHGQVLHTERGSERTIEVTLPRVTGMVVVSAPIGTRLTLVNGDVLGTVGRDPLRVAVPPGAQRIVAMHEGYLPVEREIEVVAGAEVALQLTLTPLPPAPATLTVTANRPARVELDARHAGRTPLLLPRISPGRHRLRVVAPGAAPWSGTVELVPGARAYATADLQPADSGRRPVWPWIVGAVGLSVTAGGGMVGLVALGTHDDFERAVAAGDPSQDHLARRGRLENALADGMMLVGLSATAVAIVGLAVTGTHPPPSRAQVQVDAPSGVP